MTLENLLNSVLERPTPDTYLDAVEHLRKLKVRRKPVRMVWLSSCTMDPLLPYLEVELARWGFGLQLRFGPFGSIHQPLLAPLRKSLAHGSDFVVVAQQLDDACPPLIDDFLTLTRRQIDAHVKRVISEIAATLKTFTRQYRGTVFLFNFTLPRYPLLGLFEPMADISQTEAVHRLNTALAKIAKSMPSVFIVDAARMASDVGHQNWFDARMKYLARSP